MAGDVGEGAYPAWPVGETVSTSKASPTLTPIEESLYVRQERASQFILQYVDEAFPAAAGGAPILPSDPYDKLYRTWVPVFRSKTAEEMVEAATQVVVVLETLEQQAFKECSKGKHRSSEGTPPGSSTSCLVKVTPPKTPLLVAWAERFCALDAVKGLIPDVDRLVEYNKARRAGLGLPLLLPYVELQQ